MQPWPVTFRFPVRWREVDLMGHANNAAIAAWFEDARVEYVRALAKGGPLGARDFPFILARAEIDYRAPAALGDEVEVSVRVARFGRSSFDFEYEARRVTDGVALAQARTVQAWYDYAKGSPVPLPETFKERVRLLQGDLP